jgi:hypothetical protein
MRYGDVRPPYLAVIGDAVERIYPEFVMIIPVRPAPGAEVKPDRRLDVASARLRRQLRARFQLAFPFQALAFRRRGALGKSAAAREAVDVLR